MALGRDLLLAPSLRRMDYRKIGLVLERNRDGERAARARFVEGSLADRPLAELGLTGLVERLALAIHRSRGGR